VSEQNSLARMLGILALFDEAHTEWTPDALIERTGFSRPTLYRYLKTLKDGGLLVTINQAAYSLGPKVVEMDFLLRQSDPLVVESQNLLAELAARHPGTAFLSRWYRDRLLCVTSVRTSEEAVSSYPRGRPMPLGRGSASHAILAFLPRRQLDPIIDSRIADFEAIGYGGTRDAVLARFRAIRKAGVAVARGEVTPGVVGVAAPIFDSGAAPIASLCLTMAERYADAAGIDRLAGEVREFAARISERLTSHRRVETDG
jgi:DNA-binding IclR family transcriptional regulator